MLQCFQVWIVTMKCIYVGYWGMASDDLTYGSDVLKWRRTWIGGYVYVSREIRVFFILELFAMSKKCRYYYYVQHEPRYTDCNGEMWYSTGYELCCVVTWRLIRLWLYVHVCIMPAQGQLSYEYSYVETLIYVTLQAILMPLSKRHLTRRERHIMSFIMSKSRGKSLANFFCLYGAMITPTRDLAVPYSKPEWHDFLHVCHV